jgi:predicted nucleotidyltransferase
VLPVIEQRREAIADLCRLYGVRRLDLFGSAASSAVESTESDADFLVEFDEQRPLGAADRYFGLREGLQALLGRSIDLVVRGAVRNPYFLRSAELGSQTLYAS